MNDTNPTEVPAEASVPAAAENPQPQYEFDAAQNEVINNLAMAMMWVRIPLIVTGVVQSLIAIGLALRLSKDGAHIVAVIGHTLAAIVCFLLAGWLFKASVAFARVTTTTGRDITHLMNGLRNLASWFDLLAFFVKLYLALLAVLLGLLLVGLVTGAFKGPG
jgi:hypothetical protein